MAGQIRFAMTLEHEGDNVPFIRLDDFSDGIVIATSTDRRIVKQVINVLWHATTAQLLPLTTLTDTGLVFIRNLADPNDPTNDARVYLRTAAGGTNFVRIPAGQGWPFPLAGGLTGSVFAISDGGTPGNAAALIELSAFDN